MECSRATKKRGKIVATQDLKLFYVKRALRIYPLYFFSIILFWLLEISDSLTLIKATFLISVFFKPSPPTLWFITMIIVYYILAPFLIDECKKLRIKRLIFYYALATAVLLAYDSYTDFLDDRILIYFPAFLLGIYTAENRIKTFNKKIIFGFLFFGFWVFIISLHRNFSQHYYFYFFIKLTIASTVPFYIFKFLKNYTVSSLKLKKIIIYLSYSSYAMYLFHRPGYLVLKKLYFPDTLFYELIYLMFFCLPCIFIFSYSLQKVYDMIIKKTVTVQLMYKKLSLF